MTLAYRSLFVFLFPKKGKALICECNGFYFNVVEYSPLFSVGFGTGIYKMHFVVSIDNFVLAVCVSIARLVKIWHNFVMFKI